MTDQERRPRMRCDCPCHEERRRRRGYACCDFYPPTDQERREQDRIDLHLAIKPLGGAEPFNALLSPRDRERVVQAVADLLAAARAEAVKPYVEREQRVRARCRASMEAMREPGIAPTDFGIRAVRADEAQKVLAALDSEVRDA